MLKGIFRSVLFASNLCFIVLLPLLASAAGTNVPGISFDAQHGKLTTNITNQPLSEVMQQISAQSGIKSTVMPAADRSISLQLTDIPLEAALKQLLRDTNYVFMYQKRDKKYVVSGVRVLATGEEGVLPAPVATASLAGNDTGKKDKENSPEHLRQQKIESIKLNKLRRDRKLPPVFLSKTTGKAAPRRERRAAP
ncbi:MAG: STN domain-containing protein [Pseudomonadota bacterium]